MPDILYNVSRGGKKRLKDMGDGTHAEVLALSETVPALFEFAPHTYSAFGELITGMNTPVLQFSFVHWIPSELFQFSLATGSVSRNGNSEVEVSTGTNSIGFAVIRSKRALIYRPGQGNMTRFTARFSTGAANSEQTAGLFSTTDGFVFGYNGADFGIRHAFGGEQEIRSLQVTTFASGSETATVTVDGVGHSVSLTGVGTVEGDAQEIATQMNALDALATYEQVDDTIHYVRAADGPQASSFTYSSATSEATWATITTGVLQTENWITQEDWNVDARATLDPTKGNVYQIQFQYLGYGDIQFFIEDPEDGELKLVHVIQYANNFTRPSLTNPSMFVALVANNKGSNPSNLVVSSSSMAAFRQGQQVLTNLGRSFGNQKTISTTAVVLFTIRNRNHIGGRASHGELILKDITASTESTKGAVIEIYANADVGGAPDCQYIDENESLALYDTAGTTVSGGRLIGTINLGGSGDGDFDLAKLNEIVLAGEQITVAGRVTSSPSSIISAALTWAENI